MYKRQVVTITRAKVRLEDARAKAETIVLPAAAAQPARRIGAVSYTHLDVYKRQTDARGDNTADELWLVEHDPVFTLGQAGKPEHVLMPGDIPVLQVDRGGHVTYLSLIHI